MVAGVGSRLWVTMELDGPQKGPGNVLVVASRRAAPKSMVRYSRILVAGWRAVGSNVEEMSPPSCLSDRARGNWMKKVATGIEQLVLFPIILRKAVRRFECLHVADHSDAFLLFAVPRAIVSMVTVHDMFGVLAERGEIPEFRPRLIGRLRQRMVAQALARRAAILFSISDATARDLRRTTGRHSALLRNPVDPSVGIESLPSSDRDPSPFMMVVGAGGWRKRRDRAIGVWLRLRQTKLYSNARLIIVGEPLTAVEMVSVEAAGLTHRIEHQAEVSDGELASLYQRSAALLQMSKYEGFAWPVVEANRLGCPAVCADIAVLRETGGAGALYVSEFAELDAVDWSGFAEMLARLTGSGEPQANADRFTWERFVMQLGGGAP